MAEMTEMKERKKRKMKKMKIEGKKWRVRNGRKKEMEERNEMGGKK